MAKLRRRSRVALARRIVGDVRRHPSNRRHPNVALARAAGWQVWKRVVRRPLTVRVYGGRMRLQPDSGGCANIAYFGQLFDPDEMAFLSRYLWPGDRFIDGGANVGSYTLLAARAVGPLGHVHAFEPAPKTAEWLAENIRLNDLANVTLHKVALSDSQGTVSFTDDLDVGNTIARNSRSQSNVTVAAGRLDQHVPTDDTYALAKLDLEGAEVLALHGASGLLDRGALQVLLVEALPGQLARFGHSINDLMDLLATHGFRVGSYDAESGRLDLSAATGPNLLAVHRSSVHDVLLRLEARG